MVTMNVFCLSSPIQTPLHFDAWHLATHPQRGRIVYLTSLTLLMLHGKNQTLQASLLTTFQEGFGLSPINRIITRTLFPPTEPSIEILLLASPAVARINQDHQSKIWCQRKGSLINGRVNKSLER